jgi:hypothetical protein
MHTRSRRYRVHGRVFATLNDGETTILLLERGKRVVPTSLIPFKSRVPNSLLWVTWSAAEDVLEIEPRADDDDAPSTSYDPENSN